MTQNEFVLYILFAVLALIMGGGGIFAFIKWLKSHKISDKEWEAQLKFCAFLLEQGVPIPNEILIPVMRRELPMNKFATNIKTLTNIDFKKFKKNIKKK